MDQQHVALLDRAVEAGAGSAGAVAVGAGDVAAATVARGLPPWPSNAM